MFVVKVYLKNFLPIISEEGHLGDLDVILHNVVFLIDRHSKQVKFLNKVSE